MKNKFLLTIISMLIFTGISHAAVNVKVSAEEEFRTDSPSDTINVRITDDVILGEYELKCGDILECKVLKIKKPKRGKRNATFTVQPQIYISDGVKNQITQNLIGKYSKTVFSKHELKKMPKGQLVEKAAITVGSHYVKCLGQGISLAEGIIENEDGNRIKSGIKKVYKDSPLSYVEQGKELDIQPYEEFYFVFKINNDK